jgi:hypothetical protein
MRRYSEAVKVDVTKRMSPQHCSALPGFLSSCSSICSPSIYGGRPGCCREKSGWPPRMILRSGVPPTSFLWCWRLLASIPRTQRLLPGAGFVPRAGKTLAVGIPGFNEKPVLLERAERARPPPRLGPA